MDSPFWHTLAMTDQHEQANQSGSPKRPRAGATEQPPGEPAARPAGPREVGGPQGPEPTRFGDWERKGRCIDF